MSSIPHHTRFDRKPSVIATDLQNEMVLLDPETQQMYRLNGTGRVVWRELEGHDVDGLVTLLSASFDVGSAQALEDVQRLLTDLLGAGLITAASRPG